MREKKPPTSSSNALKESLPSEESSVFPCKWVGCDGLYSEQDDLVRHIEKVHIDQRKADDLYICYWKDCSRQRRAFNARYKLVIHMRVHSGEKPNKCTVSSTTNLLCRIVFVLHCFNLLSYVSRQLFYTQFVRSREMFRQTFRAPRRISTTLKKDNSSGCYVFVKFLKITPKVNFNSFSARRT